MFNRIIFSFLLLYSIDGVSQQTYSEHIAPILFKHCLSCHRAGEIGPMPLTTYEEVAAYGSMLAFVTKERYMPPWKADATYSHFKNENVLTEEEITTIQRWVDIGMPRGSAVVFMPETVDEEMRSPDLMLSMSESFEQYGIYFDQYQVFVLPTNLNEDTYVSAIEFVPGNRDIVKHCVIALDTSDAAHAFDAWDPRYGYNSFGGFGFEPFENAWHVWSPGNERIVFPEGHARFIPKGSKLLMYVHYGPTGVPQRDSSSIRLWFAKEPPRNIIRTLPLINASTLTNPAFHLYSGDVKKYHAVFHVQKDMYVYSLYPQSQLLSRAWEVYAKKPDGSIQKLLKINDWDFTWRRKYDFDTPLLLPEGTEIHALVSFDNTLDNPHNPSERPVAIEWGTGLFQDLMVLHVEVSE